MKKPGEACIRRVDINDSVSLGKIDWLFKIAFRACREFNVNLHLIWLTIVGYYEK